MRSILFCLALLLAACGGGGGSASTEPPPPDAKPGGYYTGSFVSDVSGDAVRIDALILNSGEAFFLSSYGIYTADMSPDGDEVDTDFEAFALWGTTWDGVNTYLQGSIEATIDEGSGINGDYFLGSDEGAFNLTYRESVYEQGSSLAKVAGDWGITYPDTGYTITISVDSSGHFFGQDTNGCTLQGDIALVDTDYNAYRMQDVKFDCYDVSLSNGHGVMSIGKDDQGAPVMVHGIQFDAQKVALVDFFFKI